MIMPNVVPRPHFDESFPATAATKSMQKGEIPDPRAGSTKFRAPPLSAAGVRVGYNSPTEVNVVTHIPCSPPFSDL